MARAVLVAVLAVLAFAPGALAAGPTLVSATQGGGKVSASWTLPAGGQAWTLEVSKSSAVDSDGYFLLDAVVDTAVFVDGTTSWTSDVVLPAGTYYVHVSGADLNCATCPYPQWSAVRTVTVGGSGTTTGSTSGGTSPAPTGGDSSGTTGGTTPEAPSPPTTPQPGDTAPSAPTVGYGTVGSVAGRLKGGVASVSFRICGSGPVEVTVAVTRGKASHTAVVTLPLDGCTSYALRLSAPGGTGKVSVGAGTGGAVSVSKQL